MAGQERSRDVAAGHNIGGHGVTNDQTDVCCPRNTYAKCHVMAVMAFHMALILKIRELLPVATPGIWTAAEIAKFPRLE